MLITALIKRLLRRPVPNFFEDVVKKSRWYKRDVLWEDEEGEGGGPQGLWQINPSSFSSPSVNALYYMREMRGRWGWSPWIPSDEEDHVSVIRDKEDELKPEMELLAASDVDIVDRIDQVLESYRETR